MTIRRLILDMSVPLTTRMGQIHLSPSHRMIKAKYYRELIPLLQPGDIFISFMKGELTNLFISGFWGHAALYCGDEIIVESTAEGVHTTDLIDFMMSKDAIAVLRVPRLEMKGQPETARAITMLIQSRIVDLALQACGCPYDLFFEPGSKALYCAELITYVYNSAFKEYNIEFKFKTRLTMGVETVFPQDFWDSGKFEIVSTCINGLM